MPLRTDFMEKGSEVREAKYLPKVTQDVLGTNEYAFGIKD